jgi:hypothetical protein
MKLKRRPLKTIPWDRKAGELKQATQRWIDSGGKPDLFKEVERLTREVRKLAQAATPARKRVTKKLRAWIEEAKKKHAPTTAEIINFVESLNTWFRSKSVHKNLASFTSRKYSRDGENPGKKDLREADRLEKLILKQYGNRVSVTDGGVDEYVTIEVTIR